ncbi:MAG: 2-amino-4-hydroxy-6-hydroxymethyldihydropteridine diphosphokinase [Bacteroidota bacterium]
MIFLGLGTNQGNRPENLQAAISRLGKQQVEILRCSGVYLTPPWGVTNQPDFMNMVVEVQFPGSPLDLLYIALEVEQLMGRIRKQKWGPRVIDIDLLEFNGQQLNHPDLILPHPLYHKRDFVLNPLKELEPAFIPTGQRSTVSQLADRLLACDSSG